MNIEKHTRTTTKPDYVAHHVVHLWDMKALERDGGQPPPGWVELEIEIED